MCLPARLGLCVGRMRGLLKYSDAVDTNRSFSGHWVCVMLGTERSVLIF